MLRKDTNIKNDKDVDSFSVMENFISNNSEKKLATWLKQVLKNSDFSPFELEIGNEISLVEQLQCFHDDLSINYQEKFKNAVILSVAEWSPSAHGVNLLCELSVLAAYIRATEVIDYLFNYIKNDWLRSISQREYEETIKTILAVLTGFAPSEKIKHSFEELFFDNYYEKFAAHLFIGLCKCQPEEYPKYFSRFIYFQEKNPDFYKLPFVISQFARIVPYPIRQDKFNLLSLNDKQKLTKLINDFTEEVLPPLSQDILIEHNPTVLEELIEYSQSIRNKLMRLTTLEDVVKESLKLVKEKFNSQIASLFMFSKDGCLHRIGLNGVDKDGNDIDNSKWFIDENYEVNENSFIGMAAKAAKSKNSVLKNDTESFGKPQSISFDQDKLDASLPSDSQKEYKILGKLNCGIAIPLNGQNKTFGVLVVVNKINPETQKPLNHCTFLPQDFLRLSAICISVANTIYSLRKNKQKSIVSNLIHYLVSSSYDNRDEVYKDVTNSLVSEDTSFQACILRRKNERNELEVVAQAPSGSSESLVNWKSRKNLNVKLSDEYDFPAKATNEKNYIIEKISDSNFKNFGSNSKWVNDNDFKKFACFPLVSKGMVVGTLSLYTSYDYDFHNSSIEFINEVTILIASLIRRLNEEKSYSKLNSSLYSLSNLTDKLNKELMNKTKSLNVPHKIISNAFDDKVFKKKSQKSIDGTHEMLNILMKQVDVSRDEFRDAFDKISNEMNQMLEKMNAQDKKIEVLEGKMKLLKNMVPEYRKEINGSKDVVSRLQNKNTTPSSITSKGKTKSPFNTGNKKNLPS